MLISKEAGLYKILRNTLTMTEQKLTDLYSYFKYQDGYSTVLIPPLSCELVGPSFLIFTCIAFKINVTKTSKEKQKIIQYGHKASP